MAQNTRLSGRPLYRHSRVSGNPAPAYHHSRRTPLPSFPRKRESRTVLPYDAAASASNPFPLILNLLKDGRRLITRISRNLKVLPAILQQVQDERIYGSPLAWEGRQNSRREGRFYTQLPWIIPAGILEKPVIPDKVPDYEMPDLQARGSR